MLHIQATNKMNVNRFKRQVSDKTFVVYFVFYSFQFFFFSLACVPFCGNAHKYSSLSNVCVWFCFIHFGATIDSCPKCVGRPHFDSLTWCVHTMRIGPEAIFVDTFKHRWEIPPHARPCVVSPHFASEKSFAQFYLILIFMHSQ